MTILRIVYHIIIQNAINCRRCAAVPALIFRLDSPLPGRGVLFVRTKRTKRSLKELRSLRILLHYGRIYLHNLVLHSPVGSHQNPPDFCVYPRILTADFAAAPLLGSSASALLPGQSFGRRPNDGPGSATIAGTSGKMGQTSITHPGELAPPDGRGLRLPR